VNEQIILNKILEARDKRAKIRGKFVTVNKASISLTFNIPGYPKHNDLLDKCFDFVKADLEVFLQANRIFIDLKSKLDVIDDAGRFFIIPLNEKNLTSEQIKELAEKFEQKHFLQRVIDVDIFDASGKPVSSGKQKKCLICDKPANICRLEKNHSFDELRNFVFNRMNKFFFDRRKEQIVEFLSLNAQKATLLEVSLTPKPGLVDFNDSGSHSDMNFNTFMVSSAAISVYWRELAGLGFYKYSQLSEVLPEIREIGLKAEMKMFGQTNNVNTQKGLIFLLGLSVFATAFSLKDNDNFNPEYISEIIKNTTLNIVENELINNQNEFFSNGEKLFEKYGLKAAGARFQAQKGLPLVFEIILPYLRENMPENYLENKIETDKILLTALLKIISKLDDTNVLHRNGIIIAEELKKFAKRVVDGKMSYNKFSEFCTENNISSGGAADILAVSLFFYFTEKQFNS